MFIRSLYANYLIDYIIVKRIESSSTIVDLD